MADIVPAEVRKRMMAGIGAKNTKPEVFLRSGLHRKGFRFRLHYKGLPGRPDLVFPKYKAVIFMHGCFWHGHDCHLFKWPKTRVEFWKQKIVKNRERDARQQQDLLKIGWRIGIVWECALKGKKRLPVDLLMEICSDWLLSDKQELRLSGDEARTTR